MNGRENVEPVMGVTGWTGRRIFIRLVVGAVSLALLIGLSAWLLYASTDPLSDRREARLAAIESWQAMTDIEVFRSLGGDAEGDTSPTLVIVTVDPRSSLGNAKLVRTADDVAARIGRGRSLVVLATTNPLTLTALARESGAFAALSMQHFLSELLAGGADGLLIVPGIGPAAPVETSTIASLGHAVDRIRDYEPNLLILADRSADETIVTGLADKLDGFINFATAPRVVRATDSEVRPVGNDQRRPVFRDWLHGKPMLILETTNGKERLAKTFDFLPRTRLP